MSLRLLSAAALLLAPHAVLAIQTTPADNTVQGRFIVTYRDGAIPPDAEARAQHAGAALVRRHERLGVAILQIHTGEQAGGVTRRLALDPRVETVVADRLVSGHAITVGAAPVTAATAHADALYEGPQGWAIRQVGGFGATAEHPTAQGPWNVTRGDHVRIAMLDSGMDAGHPDIAPNLALNLSEIDQSASTGLPSPCDDGSPLDQVGHGTWTASLAAGALGPSTGLVAGVAPGANLLNIKVLQRMPSATGDCASGEASGLLSWVIQGIEDAVANRADIISMSLGTLVDVTTGDGAGLKATFDHVTHAAFSAGVILIAAAGNDGFNLADQRYVELPAQSRDVLAIVASTNPACAENLLAGGTCAPGPITTPYYSNFGAPLHALAAPGGSYPPSQKLDPAGTAASGWIAGACSTAGAYGCFNLGHVAYVQAMGTSAAAPIAAGVAALIRAAHPEWSAAAVVANMRSTAIPISTLPAPQITATASVIPASINLQPVTTGTNLH